jgi:hypothetical protein
VISEHLTAGQTPAKHAAETAPPPPPSDSPEARAIEAFWARNKGPHAVRVTNGTSFPVCTLLASADDAKAPPSSKKGKTEAAADKRVNVLLVPLRPGESRELGKVGGSGSFPVTVSTCDGKLQGTFTANRDRDTTVSLQPAGKAPKAGQGVAVFLLPAP